MRLKFNVSPRLLGGRPGRYSVTPYIKTHRYHTSLINSIDSGVGGRGYYYKLVIVSNRCYNWGSRCTCESTWCTESHAHRLGGITKSAKFRCVRQQKFGHLKLLPSVPGGWHNYERDCESLKAPRYLIPHSHEEMLIVGAGDMSRIDCSRYFPVIDIER